MTEQLPEHLPIGWGKYEIAVSPTKRDALGEDAGLVLNRVVAMLEALAALRTGIWRADERVAGEPGRQEWAYVIRELGELEDIVDAVMSAAIREHQRHGGTVDELAELLHQPRANGRAQRRRERVVGVRSRPLDPDANELWARTGVRPPEAENAP